MEGEQKLVANFSDKLADVMMVAFGGAVKGVAIACS